MQLIKNYQKEGRETLEKELSEKMGRKVVLIPAEVVADSMREIIL